MKILMVDDSIPFLNAMGAILEEAGYTDIVKKESAAEAIAFLQAPDRKITGNNVDIILMDVMMPGMDGIEAVSRIKGIEALRDIPIIMVSSQDEEEKIKLAFDAGAIDFINKPVKKLELQARLRSVIKLKAEMDQRKAHQEELEKTVIQLQEALDKVNTLSGLLPICSFCKKVRDDKGYWQQLESYISTRSEADFSHSICPDCIRQHYPEFARRTLQDKTGNNTIK